MNVSLPKELEEFVRKTAAAGAYPSADAVIAAALREFQSKPVESAEPDWLRPLPDGSCPPELKAMLLEAVNGPHHPMPPDYFDQIIARLHTTGAK